MIFIGRQKSSAETFFHSLCSDIFRRYVAGFIFRALAHLQTRSHWDRLKMTSFRFVLFKNISPYLSIKYRGLRGSQPLTSRLRSRSGKRCTFSALVIIKLPPSVNTIQAMRLLLTGQKIADFLSHARISGFLQNSEY